MRWKKIAAYIAMSSVVLIPSLALIITAALPRAAAASDRYIMSFDTNTTEGQQKQNYVDQLKHDVKGVLDKYQASHPGFKSLNLQIINLKSKPTTGQKNFFVELDRAVKAIDPRLGVTMLARTPVTVNDGFYNHNNEMMSSLWAPDYNGVGTWIAPMFTDIVAMPNYWQALYPELDIHQNDLGPNGRPSWQNSLYHKLKKDRDVVFSVKDKKDPKKTNKVTLDILQSYTDLIGAGNAIGVTSDSYYTAIANMLGTWIQQNGSSSSLGKADDCLGIQFVNWINSLNPAIPFQEDGPNTQTMQLIKAGDHQISNANADDNFRDWYVDGSQSNKEYRWWNDRDPFSSNITPYNQSFNEAPNSMFFQSTGSSLYSWTTNGDYPKNDKDPNTMQLSMVADGTTTKESDFGPVGVDPFDNPVAPFMTANADGSFVLKFKIRPQEWIDSNGKPIINKSTGNPYYLSPKDYWAGLKGFERSTDINLNSNSYFLDLISLDKEATLTDKSNQDRTTDPLKPAWFSIHLSAKPQLGLPQVLDILTKQYFQPLPAFKDSVKNITEDSRFNKIAKLNGGTIDKLHTDMKKFYGSGDALTTWRDWASTGSYYVSNVSSQSVVYTRNDNYFSNFNNSVNNEVKNDPINYESFQIKDPVNNRSKFKTISMKYAGSYSPQITYQAFANNQLDSTKIPLAEIPNVSAKYGNDDPSKSAVYAPQVSKIKQGYSLAYNTNIYYKDSNGIIKDTNDKSMTAAGSDIKPAYTIDDNGNYVFPNGRRPDRKSHITDAYEDLIVNNFFTPYTPQVGADGWNKKEDVASTKNNSSQIIRTAINDSINWYSIAAAIDPATNSSVQYSFMPFGVYSTDNGPDSTVIQQDLKYWYIASGYVKDTAGYKSKDPTIMDVVKQLEYPDQNHPTVPGWWLNQPNPAKRLGGLMPWGIDEMKDSWKLKFPKVD